MAALRFLAIKAMVVTGILLSGSLGVGGEEPAKPTRLGRPRPADKESAMHSNSIAFSADAKKLAWVFHLPQTRREEGGLEIVVWDLDKGKLMTNLVPTTEVTFAASPVRFTPDGDMVFLGCFQIITEYTALGRPGTGLHNSVRFWNLANDKEREIIPYEKTYSHERFESVTINGDGNVVSAVRSKGGAAWSFPDGRVARKFADAPATYWLTMSADGKTAAGSLPKDISKPDSIQANVWNTEDGKSVFTTPGTALQISPDGKQLATHTDADIEIWDVATKKKRFALPSDIPEKERTRIPCAFSAKGKYVAWSVAGKVHVADTATGKVRWTLNAEPGPVTFSPDENSLAVGCSDGTALLWNLAKTRDGK
jgi:WD40 repeat protein